MKILLWEIRIVPRRLAKIQWMLFKLFNYKPKHPCGLIKKGYGYSCHQPFTTKYCNIINDAKNHEVRCKCCGEVRMISSSYIDPYNEDEWISF